MVFSSITFLLYFLPLFLTLYYLVPGTAKNLTLLLASLVFYAWGEGVFFAVMLFSITANYGFGRWLDACADNRRGRVLTLALSANLLLLGVFKYANLVMATLNAGLAQAGAGPVAFTPVHLPLGISFFTFQCMSYLIDLYRREIAAERNLITFGTYICMFPHLVAGPIVRYAEIRGELHNRRVDSVKLALGAQWFIVGFAHKMLIANTLAVAADDIFALPAHELRASVAWFGAVCYGLQIYFDFMGYSVMAIGLALMLGFHFPRNFDYPYISQSITEFWRRWHMTLSRWFRDYLYIPLGGNRKGRWQTGRNLFVVFALCGLWHGASWTFVIWGVYHGLFLVLERGGLGSAVARAPRPLRHGYALLVLLVGWVFFRCDSLRHALDYLAAMTGRNAMDPAAALELAFYARTDTLIALAAGAVLSTPVYPWLDRTLRALPPMAATRVLATAAGAPRYENTMPLLLLAVLFALSLMALAAGTHNPFIYFRF